MASIIRIKRSSTAGNPGTLGAGELAYSAYSGSGGNRLYIGMGTETAGNAANHLVIGGTYYTGLVDASVAGTLTTNASSIPVLSATGTIDKWLVSNIQIGGSSSANTIQATNTNGNLVLSGNGTGQVQIAGTWTLPNSAGTNGYALITNGTSAATWQPISTVLQLATDNSGSSSVNLLNQTLSIRGGNGIVTSISGQTVTISSIGAGGYTSTATGGGTTTLTSSSSANQFFTGTTTQTVKLPDTTTLTIGQEYYITNQSTGALTIQTSAGGAITTIPSGAGAVFTVASTSAQTWVTEFNGSTSVTGSGSLVLANSPALTSPSFSTIVNTGTLTLPTSTDTLVGRATTDTLTNKTFDTAGAGNVLKINGNQITSFVGSGANVVLSTNPTITNLYTTGTGMNFGGSSSGNTNVVAAATASGTLTLPSATDTLVGRNTTDTLTNKTLTSPTINTPTITTPTITGHVTVEGVTSTGATGTGNLVFSNAPTLVTPTLGVASATSLTTSAGLYNTGVFSGTFSDGIIVDYTTGVGRISVGSGDGISLYNNTDTTRQAIFAVGSTGAVTLLGGSITGTTALTLTAGGTNSNVNLVPTGTGTVDVAGARITSVGTPTQATDAATKAYVDGLKSGLDVKYPVRLATTGSNLTVTASGSGAGKTLTNAGTQAALVIDSVPAVVGDRILVKDQTTTKDNGIYTVTSIGSASTNWVLTRATDADGASTTGTVTPGMFCFVTEGTQNANSGYVLAEFSPDVATITVDTNAQTWIQFSGAGEITAGSGLSKSGNTLSVVGTANRITVGASVDIASTYVGQNSITTLGTITTGSWQAGVIGATYGGTGVNNGSNTITLGGNISTAGSFTTTGAYSLGLTVTGATSLTLPTSGTLATLTNAETLSNKTITSSSFSGSTGSFTSNVTVGGTLGVTGAATLSSTLAVTGNVTLSANITGAGASTSTIDGFTIDGGTY